MKRKFLFIILTFFIIGSHITANVSFKDHFTDEALRIDFVLAGNKTSQRCYIDQILHEPFWGGRRHKLDTSLNLGEYRIDVRESRSKKLIYSEGFCTLFEEWRTTAEASKINRSFTNAIQIPFPKQLIEITILYRVKGDFSDTLQHFKLDPESQIIAKASLPKATVKQILNNGSSPECVDLVILAEGYAEDDQELFFEEAQKLAMSLFTSAPFKKNKKKFNIYAVGIVSEESGVDNPHENSWVKTALNASFNTFYSDRYLMSPDVRTVRNYAALVPYDQIYILANSDKYGGGGIYNYYSLCTSRGRSENEVFIHEFGHAFAGLGDEYYSSNVSYSDYFDLSLEPWQPNLTTLVNFNIKWKALIDDKTPVPTPDTAQYRKRTGVFEGGGYSAKNIYRPAFDCRMKTNEAKDFCEVCSLSVEKTIQFLTE